jgi:putative transposase
MVEKYFVEAHPQIHRGDAMTKYPHFKPTNELRKDLDTIRSGKHSTYNINYHVVWIPKYRRPMLRDAKVREVLEEILRGQAESHNWKVFALEIQPDHIHVFLSVPPNEGIASVVKQLKGNTAIQLRRIFPELKEKTKKALWAKGYYVSTAGYVSQEQVKRYIDEQSIHLQKRATMQKQETGGQQQLPAIPPLNKFRGFLAVS